MTRIELAPEVMDDFERILEHLSQYQVEQPKLRIQAIIDAIDVLAVNPLIGRPRSSDADGNRELIIGKHSHGYVALYRYLTALDTVFVLAIRSQREAGYSEAKA
jgi:toxin ParE1/3/4